jgi:hypothetical protein
MRTLLIIALLGAFSAVHAEGRKFTCSDLTTKNVIGWRGTITISFRATVQRTGAEYEGRASYTVHYSNDRTLGVTVMWPGFSDSWQGEKKTGSGDYRATNNGATVASTGPLLDPDVGHWDGLGIDPHDQLQIDTSGCRYTFHAGIATKYTGDAARASLGGPAGAPDAVGFSGTIAPQKIPASATELTGSVRLELPGRRFDLLDSFYYLAYVQDFARATGTATFTWKLVPEFERTKVKIESAAVYDINNTPLKFLSASPCSRAKCGGNPRVHGTILVTNGDEKDALSEIRLDVVQNGHVVASGALAADLRSTLLRPFGAEKKIELATSRRMFEFSDAELANIDQNSDARLQLRIHVKTTKNGEDDYSVASVPKLVAYTRSNRNPRFGSDADRGGDWWVKPSVRDVYAGMGNGYVWSDFSNMNGGSFKPPHGSHQSGNDVDGVFADGSIERDWANLKHHTAATAQRLLELLNNPTYGSRIVCVFLAFKQIPSDPFWTAIKDVTLNDGRRAYGVFLSTPHVGDHETHFHFRVLDSGDKHKYKACPKTIIDGAPES